MLKKIASIAFIFTVSSTYTTFLGPHLLANSPSDYLIDLETSIKDGEVTQQVGNELFIRTYTSDVTIIDQTAGRFDERPTAAANGYTLSEGLWFWVPNAVNSVNGIWYWILKTTGYYLNYLAQHVVSF
jgi:hypothetical protein